MNHLPRCPFPEVFVPICFLLHILILYWFPSRRRPPLSLFVRFPPFSRSRAAFSSMAPFFGASFQMEIHGGCPVSIPLRRFHVSHKLPFAGFNPIIPPWNFLTVAFQKALWPLLSARPPLFLVAPTPILPKGFFPIFSAGPQGNQSVFPPFFELSDALNERELALAFTLAPPPRSVFFLFALLPLGDPIPQLLRWGKRLSRLLCAVPFFAGLFLDDDMRHLFVRSA